MTELDVTFVAIAVMVIFASLVTIKIFLSYQNQGSKYLKLKMKEMEDFQLYQKQQLRVYKNKVSNSHIRPTVEANLETDGSMEQMIPALISKYQSQAPSWLKPILSTPGITEWAIGMAKENPEQAKNLLSQFIPKKGNDVSTTDAETSTKNSLEQYSGA